MKFKRLIPALAMLLVSAILLGTSTFAWFSMNTQVSATNMQVKAVSDQGLLINEVATATDAGWDNEATNTYGDGVAPIQLHATSTANTKAWYVAHSRLQDNAAAATAQGQSANLVDGYKVLGTSEGYTAVGTETVTAAVGGATAQQDVYYVDKGGVSGYDNGEGYYAKFTYYVKSSAGAITTSTAANGQTFNIKSVIAEKLTTTSVALDKSLRVAVVVGGKAYIFAPLYAADDTDPLPTYYVNAATATTPLDHTVSQPTALATIPATDANGAPVEVYIYFEGEDTNLKTSNALSALDNIKVSINFELKTNTSAVTDSGITVPNN